MNGLVFAIAAWIVVGLDNGLPRSLALQFGDATIVPSLSLILMTWIALSATPQASVWSALALGLLVDLTHPERFAEAERTITIAGPYALAFLVAARLVVAGRWVMLRRNPVALALMTVAAGFIVTIVSAVPLTIHQVMGDGLAWRAWPHILGGFGSAFYSALIALPMGLLLNPMSGWFGLNPARPASRRLY